MQVLTIQSNSGESRYIVKYTYPSQFQEVILSFLIREKKNSKKIHYVQQLSENKRQTLALHPTERPRGVVVGRVIFVSPCSSGLVALGGYLGSHFQTRWMKERSQWLAREGWFVAGSVGGSVWLETGPE